MTEGDWEKLPYGEGFTHTFVCQDGPHTFYPDHVHSKLTAHVILNGKMTVASEGVTRTFKAGERVAVPAGAVHSARMGPQGCTYVVGEKSPGQD